MNKFLRLLEAFCLAVLMTGALALAALIVIAPAWMLKNGHDEAFTVLVLGLLVGLLTFLNYRGRTK